MFPWEPEGRYCHWLCTAIAPFWFSMEHLWAAIMPFWLSTDDMALKRHSTLVMLTWLCVCLCAWDMCRRSGNLKWIWWAIMVLTNRCLFGNMPKLWLVSVPSRGERFLSYLFISMKVTNYYICLFVCLQVCLFVYSLNYLDPFRYIINNSLSFFLCLHLKLLFLSFSFYQRKISWLKTINHQSYQTSTWNISSPFSRSAHAARALHENGDDLVVYYHIYCYIKYE